MTPSSAQIGQPVTVIISYGGAVDNNVTGSAANPNTAGYTPANTSACSFYCQDSASPVSFWGWSVSNQNWFPIVT